MRTPTGEPRQIPQVADYGELRSRGLRAEVAAGTQLATRVVPIQVRRSQAGELIAEA